MSALLLKLSDEVIQEADLRTRDILAVALSWEGDCTHELFALVYDFPDTCRYVCVIASLHEWFKELSSAIDPGTFQTVYYATTDMQREVVRKIYYWQDHLGGTESLPCGNCAACNEMRKKFIKHFDVEGLTSNKPYMHEPNLKKKARPSRSGGGGSSENDDSECGYDSMLRIIMCDP